MAVQNLSDKSQNLYRQGKYQECLAEIKRTGSEQPAGERAASLLLAAKIKRETLDLLVAEEMLQQSVELAKQAGDALTEWEALLILHAVQAERSHDKVKSKALVQKSEPLLNRIRQLRSDKIAKSATDPRLDGLYVTALCELGLTKILAGDVELAAQNLRLASGLAAEKFGTESAEMIYPSLYLAIVHALEGKHSLSQVMARNALQLARANFGKHPLVIQPLYRLAQSEIKQNLFPQALATCRQLEGVLVDLAGEDNAVYLDTLSMKTAAFMFMVEYQSAEKMASKRLKLAEKMYGKEDPRLIDSLCDLAQILAHLGERDRAEIYFDRALQMVSELARNQGFPDEMIDGEAVDKNTNASTGTTGTRLQGASLCHLEYSLIEQLSDCYLWQGKLADAARLMPASMRSKHICKVDGIVSMIEAVNKHLAERARNLELPT